MKLQYIASQDELAPSQRIARCAARLAERWRMVPVRELEAEAVWREETLREPPPDEAGSKWADH